MYEIVYRRLGSYAGSKADFGSAIPAEGQVMTECTRAKHADHTHIHGPGCGHTAVRHGDHVDYIHDGHLHHMHDGHVDEHVIEVSTANPVRCTPGHACAGHGKEHVHGPGCGHEAIPHGDHICYLVDGHLHFPHGDHCDDHGPLKVVQAR